MNQGETERTGLERALGSGLTAAPWVPAALLIVQAACLWAVCLSFGYQLQHGEGNVLHSAANLARGKTTYPPIGGYPYESTAYPPLFIALCAVGVWLGGPGFLVGRVISWVSGITVAVSGAVMVGRETGSRAAAAVAGVLIPGVVFVAWWMAVMRVDMLGVALAMVGLVLALRGRHTAAAAVFALALYTRQSAMAAPAAVLIVLLLERRWREGARFALVLAGALAVPFAGLMIATGGLFYTHVFGFLRLQPWAWSSLAGWGERIMVPWPGLLAMAAGTAIWALVRRRGRMLALYFVMSAVVSLTAGKVGADSNYFVEPLAAACVLTAIAYGVGLRALGAGGRARAAGVAVGAALTAQMVWMVFAFGGVTERLFEPFNARASRAVVQRLADAQGPVLCGDYGLVELAGRPVLLEAFEFTQMARAGVIDPGPVLEDVRRGRFAVIVLRMDPTAARPVGPDQDVVGGRWYGPLVNEIGAHYVVDEVLPPYYVLVPKARR